MTTEKNIILNNTEINQKLKRIAYQIYESNVNEKEIVIAGIVNNGYILAEKITKIIKEITSINVILCKVNINKKKPLLPISVSIDVDDYKNKSIVLVDDVLNSGSTLIYGVKFFLDVPLKNFKTVVLVNRNHKKYPVKADFKGISLSTSTKEHVQVEFNKDEATVYLI